MKTFGYIWKVIINLITVAIVVSVFSVASTDFETIILAVLILIYLSIGTFMAIWGISQMEFLEALDNEFRTVKNLLNGNTTKLKGLGQIFDEMKQGGTPLEVEEIDDYEKEAIKERAEKKQNTMVKFYINAGFQFIIYVITLYNLLKAL